MNKICINCNILFNAVEDRIKFCSRKCYWNHRWQTPRMLSFVCKQCNNTYKSFCSDKKKFCSKLCYSLSQKGKPISHKPHLIQAFLAKGKKPKNYELFRKKSFERQWKGGITSENEKIRKSKAYKSWRFLIFQRDNFTCQDCGHKGKIIEAHHIKEFALFPELRLDPDNGVTLCKECHDERETINQYTNPELKQEYIELARKRIGI